MNRNGVVYKFAGDRELLVVSKYMQTKIIEDAHEKGHTGQKYGIRLKKMICNKTLNSENAAIK